ncbi:MAG: 1-phosphofructokinase family hexose kinase [Angelakisella sp.]|jgi:1-phosphofructokinase family hexose kinase|nr:1-phosphofructokinase family hexose kinase [Angelakisella sp.]
MFDHIITLSLNPAIDATLWVEGIQTGADNAVLSEKYESAGKAMNVSRALRIYGVESLALVLAGAHNRERYEEPLKREGIRYTILPVPGYTRENIAIVEESRTVTRFLREGFTVPYEAVEELLLLLGREVRERTLVVISGTLPAGISDQILLDICLAIRERGGLVALDTSARFTLEEIGRFTPWLIKPNRKELEEMARRELPGTPEIVDFCRELTGRGVCHCLVSMGDSGILYAGAEGVYQVMVPNVSVVSAVGSGDYCLAGFVLGQATKKSLVQSLKTAASFGTAACLTEGTSPPTPLATANILNQVLLEKLD